MLKSARNWLHSEDHYYWITSYLAARGLQRATCRLIAVNTLGLSLIPLLTIISRFGPTGTRERWLIIAVTVSCFSLGTVWLKSGWPSRTQSRRRIVYGGACVALVCLLQPVAQLGFIGVSAFIVLSAFAALFHDGRLVAYTWIVAGATLIALAVRVGTFDPALTACVVALFVLINMFVVFICRNVIRLVSTTVHHSELDPLTGLLTRDAFFDRVATMVAARDRNDDRYLAIIVVSLDSFSLLTATRGYAGGNEARVAIGHRIAETLRRDALLAHVGESDYLLADTFSSSDAKVLTDRLQHSVRTAPYRLTASIGVVTTPIAQLVGHPPHEVIEELITITTSNMYAARRSGGQCTRATVNPTLTSLDDLDSDWDDDNLTA